MESVRHKSKNRYPFRKADGTEGETTNSKNLFCPSQVANTEKYRDGYDDIEWDRKK